MCRSSRLITFLYDRKTNDRCFFCFTAAILVPAQIGTNMVSTSCSFINLGETLLRITREYKSHRPKYWRGYLHINRLFYPRLLTLAIKWLWFCFWWHDSENQSVSNQKYVSLASTQCWRNLELRTAWCVPSEPTNRNSAPQNVYLVPVARRRHRKLQFQ